MTVQDAVRTVTVPSQAGPTQARPPIAAPQVTPLTGRDRPLTADERQFALGLVGMVVVLGAIIVAGLLVAQYVWT